MTEQPQAPEPDDQTSDSPSSVSDDHGAALERAARSIEEAEEAESDVAANEDITVRDDERAEADSNNPEGTGAQP